MQGARVVTAMFLKLWAVERARAVALFPDSAERLRGCGFRVSARMTRTAGRASHDRRRGLWTVTLAAWADERGGATDTVRHELAHIVAGIDARHGPAWRRVARAIGCQPSPYVMGLQYAPAVVGFRCERCGGPVTLGARRGKRPERFRSTCCFGRLARAPELDRAQPKRIYG